MKEAALNDFDKIYKIMCKSFPVEEIRSREGQRALFDNENYRVFCLENSGEIVSIAAVWQFDSFTFLEHLATDKDLRGGGLGKCLLREIIDFSPVPVCLEVEPPVDELTRRRIGFYERNGMHLNSYPYVQPSLGKGRDAIPLLIMTSEGKIDETTFENIKNTLYTQVYKVTI